jgi:AraC family transcriptional regulator
MAARSNNRYETLTNRISAHVQAHLDQDISIEDLAGMLGISKYHLNRLFQATTGFPLGEFIQRRRLQQAYALLSSGECSVIDASLAVGYESHSAFSRAFLKAFNCKPSDVKLGTACAWKTPNNSKNTYRRDTELQPELLELPAQIYRGLYGVGFKDNSFIVLAETLWGELSKRLQHAGLNEFPSTPVGVSLENPWQGDQTASHFFIGMHEQSVPAEIELDKYLWQQGTWARFQHKGSYTLLWQTISRIYAGWVLPEDIELKDYAIVQVYLNNPKTTPQAELRTDLYFPIQF